MTPDPTVQFPRFSQSFNRYSYVLNNPLSATDPSGFEEDGGDFDPGSDGLDPGSGGIGPGNGNSNPIWSPVESSGPGLDLNHGGVGINFGGSSLYPDPVFEGGPINVVAVSTDRFNLNFGTLAQNNGFATESFGYLEAAGPSASYGNIVASAGGLALPMPGAGLEGAATAGRVTAGAVGAGALLMLYSAEAGRGSDSLTFYHGDRLDVAKSLLNGNPLTTENARDSDFGGQPGFFLTPQLAAAVYFAAGRGFVLRYEMTFTAHDSLIAAGATYDTFTIGKHGSGQDFVEFVSPPTAFPLFNSLQVNGQISVSGPIPDK